MKKFLVYKIYTQPFDTELLSGLLWEFDITGLLENNDHISVFVPENDFTIEEKLNSSLMKLKKEMFVDSFRIEKEILEDKNWNEEWEKSREVIRISERIIIKPTFKNYSPKENEIVITLDPKMSFGTGEHQTTKLILRLLEQFIKTGMKVLDVGSGTGILAIASVKLGASKAVAVDSDEICFENCSENCTINHVNDSIQILTGKIADVKEKEFGLILANIQRNILLEIAGEIKSKLTTNGIVILSGLLAEDLEVIQKKYNSLGFKTRQVEKLDEWIAVVLSFKNRKG